MSSHRVYRYTTSVPVRHDDSLFGGDSSDSMFRDMQLRMGDIRGGGTGPTSTWPSDTFFQSSAPLSSLSSSGDFRSGRESSSSTFVEDPETKSRLFRMTFDVKNYDPKDIRVRVEDKSLIVEAKQVDARAGGKTLSEFSRRIELPDEVEADKLTSTLSPDGVLTLEAPCPPKYKSLAAAGPGVQPLSGGPQPLSTWNTPPAPAATNQPYERTSSSTLSSVSQSLPQPQLAPTVNQSPVVISVMACPSSAIPLDTPVFTPIDGGRRRLDLVLDVGRQYGPQDVVVKVDGRKMFVEATHEQKEQGRVRKTSMQREFDLAEDIDPSTVQAMMKPDGQLAIVATTRK